MIVDTKQTTEEFLKVHENADGNGCEGERGLREGL